MKLLLSAIFMILGSGSIVTGQEAMNIKPVEGTQTLKTEKNQKFAKKDMVLIVSNQEEKNLVSVCQSFQCFDKAVKSKLSQTN